MADSDQARNPRRRKAPSRDRLLELLRYDLDTGIFYRRMGRGGQSAGGVAGTLISGRYISIAIDRQHYLAHRLAFLYVDGTWPDCVDHIDGIGTNNRWANLRQASQSQNGANERLSKNNTSGRKGVQWDKERGRWKAKIKHNYKTIELGRFKSFEDACAAYEVAAVRIFGEFARLE